MVSGKQGGVMVVVLDYRLSGNCVLCLFRLCSNSLLPGV